MEGSISAPIPDLPADWEAISLGDVCNVENGCPFESKYFSERDGLPLIRVRDVNSGACKTFYSGPYQDRYLVANGDLLVGMDGEFRVRKWTAGKAVLNQRVCRLVPDAKRLDKDFLSYAIRAPLGHIEAHTPYTTVKHISARQILNIPLPFPPLDQQRQIARVLSALERTIEHHQRLILLTAELKSALMHKLFTEGSHAEPRKQTDLGPLPQSWSVVSLGKHLVAAQYGISIKGADNGTIPILRMTNQADGRIVGENLQLVNIGESDRLKYKVEPGDILFNRTNSFELVGRTAIFDLEGDFVFASYLIRLRTDASSLRPAFLNHYFNWNAVQTRLKSIASRAVGQSNISASRLKGFLIPLPSPEEQALIVRCFDRIDLAQLNRNRQLSLLRELFGATLHQLMTGQRRVREFNLSGLEGAAPSARVA